MTSLLKKQNFIITHSPTSPLEKNFTEKEINESTAINLPVCQK